MLAKMPSRASMHGGNLKLAINKFSSTIPRLQSTARNSTNNALSMQQTKTSAPLSERGQLLKKIYSPFSSLEKDGPEHNKLARAGGVWYDFFQPGNSDKMGYTELQHTHSTLLDEIDSFKHAMPSPESRLAKRLTAEYAWQSVWLESNPLGFVDSVEIHEVLSETIFKKVDFSAMPARDLPLLELPDLSYISADTSHLKDLMNNVVASHWVAETAARMPGTAGLSEEDVRSLGAAAIKGTETEAAVTQSWGKRTLLGDYRTCPIGVRSNPLRIFPYHLEIPALVRGLFEWRGQAHSDKQLHPVILACQLAVYFVHLHPFGDGNGRVGRMLMHDYLVRQGYLPAIMQDLEREDYLRMISDACNGQPGEFVLRVLTAQLEGLQNLQGARAPMIAGQAK